MTYGRHLPKTPGQVVAFVLIGSVMGLMFLATTIAAAAGMYGLKVEKFVRRFGMEEYT